MIWGLRVLQMGSICQIHIAFVQDELKWVDEHIPSSLADKALPALVDSDEEMQKTKFEISKMQ